MFENFLDGFDGFDVDALDDIDDIDALDDLDLEPIDLDGDGIEDAFAVDLDGDGELDSIMNLEDAELFTMLDEDGDGINETFVITKGVDEDGDGVIDFYAETTFLDDDMDGNPDAISSIEGFDVDGDGSIDYIQISDDYNGDGEINMVSAYEMSDDGELTEVGSWDMSELMEAENYTQYDGSEEGIVGDPSGAMGFWHPQEGNQCGVCSQEFVLEGILGRDVDGDEFREIGEENGWYDPDGGTAPENVGKILEYYGVEVEIGEGRTYEDLRSALEDGNGVIVGVDSDELWSGDDDDFFGPGMDADHAIQVIGLDESDPNNVMVIINDSGVANGQGAMIPLDDFMDAWEDAGCFMMEAFADSIN